MIQLRIVKTVKGYAKVDKWQRYDEELKSFSSVKDAKEWLRETYGKSRRTPMYVDTKDGQSKRIGYVIGFRNADMSHYPIEKWLQQDWIEFREVKTQHSDITPKRKRWTSMDKIIRVGKIKPAWTKKGFDIFCRIKFVDGNLSISGVMGPLASGDAEGSCGQIDMEFEHRNPKDNDKKHQEPIKASEIEYAPGWDKEQWYEFLDIWEKYHLNGMQAVCEHQRELGWKYDSHHDPKTFRGEACPVCGYEIGSAWLRMEVPYSVIDWLAALPSTDKKPAWV